MYPFRPLKSPRLMGATRVDDTVAAPLRCRVYRAGSWRVVQIDGELDVQSVPAVPPLLASRGALVVFDLHRTTFMDCSGLALLLGTARTASQVGGCVRLAGANNQVRRLVGITGLGHVLSMFDSLADALAAPTERSPQAAVDRS